MYKHGQRKEGKLHKPFWHKSSNRITVPSICISVQGREVTGLTLTGELLLHVQIYHFCHFCVANTSIFLNKNTCEFLIFVRIYHIEVLTIQKSHTCYQGLAPQRLPKQNSPCHRNSVLKVFYSSILNQDPVLQHKLVPREGGNLDQVCQVSKNQRGCQKKYMFILSLLFLTSVIVKSKLWHTKISEDEPTILSRLNAHSSLA